jgi:hypothetical protein
MIIMNKLVGALLESQYLYSSCRMIDSEHPIPQCDDGKVMTQMLSVSCIFHEVIVCGTEGFHSVY